MGDKRGTGGSKISRFGGPSYHRIYRTCNCRCRVTLDSEGPVGFGGDRAVPDAAQAPESRPAAPQRPLGRRVRALAARSMHPFSHGQGTETPLEALGAPPPPRPPTPAMRPAN